MPTKTAKKVSPKTPAVKKSTVLKEGKVVSETLTPVPGNPLIIQQMDTLVGLIGLAKNNATGDRSPQSYNAEMDALQKAFDLATELRKSYG